MMLLEKSVGGMGGIWMLAWMTSCLFSPDIRIYCLWIVTNSVVWSELCAWVRYVIRWKEDQLKFYSSKNEESGSNNKYFKQFPGIGEKWIKSLTLNNSTVKISSFLWLSLSTLISKLIVWPCVYPPMGARAVIRIGCDVKQNSKQQ